MMWARCASDILRRWLAPLLHLVIGLTQHFCGLSHLQSQIIAYTGIFTPLISFKYSRVPGIHSAVVWLAQMYLEHEINRYKRLLQFLISIHLPELLFMNVKKCTEEK